jgi:hypothetical protein
VEIAAGARVSARVFRWTPVDEMNQTGQNAGSTTASRQSDMRLGSYLAAAWPAASRFRLRAEVGVDGSVTRLFGSAAPVDEPALPSWGARMGFGIESRFP